MRTLARITKIHLFSQLWQLTKGLQHLGEHLFKKVYWIVVRTISFWCLNLSYFHPPFPSSVITLKTKSLTTTVKTRNLSQCMGKNKFRLLQTALPQKICQSWTWQLPERLCFQGFSLFDLTQSLLCEDSSITRVLAINNQW